MQHRTQPPSVKGRVHSPRTGQTRGSPRCLLKCAKHTDNPKVGHRHRPPPQTPETKTLQALRATRDRERAQLRALIAQKRRKSADKLKGGGGGDEEILNGAPRDDLGEPLLLQEWSSPRNWAAAGGRPPASEPPPRPAERLRSTPPAQRVAPGGKGGGVDDAGSSVNASRRRRRPRSNNHSSSKDDNGAGEVDARAGGKGTSGVERCGTCYGWQLVAVLPHTELLLLRRRKYRRRFLVRCGVSQALPLQIEGV